MSEAKRSGFWIDKRVFLTGCSGFLGGWLTRQLNRLGATTIGLVRDRVQHLAQPESAEVVPQFVVHGALEDHDTILRAINEYEADTVFHIGAQPIVGVAVRNPRSTFEANIRGTWNLLDACREVEGKVQRIVVASSDKAYGHSDRLPYDEEMPDNTIYKYLQ